MTCKPPTISGHLLRFGGALDARTIRMQSAT